MYQLQRISSLNEGEENIKVLYSFYSRLVEKYKLLNTNDTLEKYLETLRVFFKAPNELVLIKACENIFGILSFVKNYDWNGKEQYQLTVMYDGTEMNKDCMDLLNTYMDEKLAAFGEIILTAYNGELGEIKENYNCRIKNKGAYYTLSRNDINISDLDKCIQDISRDNMDLSLRYTDYISEDLIEQYCSLFTETMEDMTDTREDGFEQYVITPDKQRRNNEILKNNSMIHHCYMLFDKNGDMIAKSNLRISRKDPRFPYQFMVGVKRSYRGRSLGRWLYAEMYRMLYTTENFEEVLVCHHPENLPAIKLSQWVGFKYRYLITDHILSKSEENLHSV
jgi:GNAT superfamily N-acetyltransferase